MHRGAPDPSSPSSGRWRIGAWSGLTALAVLLPPAVAYPATTSASITVPEVEPVAAPPISMPDPVIVADGDSYVMATTQTADGNVPSWTSEDLERWEAGPDLLPTLPSWAAPGQTWSPSLRARSDGTWVLHAATTDEASGVQCILAATSPTPTGPFEPSDEPVVCESDRGGSIDPFVAVIDEVPYLLWATNGPVVGEPAEVHAAPLANDWLGLDGVASVLLEADLEAEGGTVSSPSLLASPTGELHLVHSAGEWGGPAYALGASSCDGPLGPCERDATALAIDGVPVGTAGAKPFLDAQAAPRFALHAPSSDPEARGVRELVLADASFIDGDLAIEVDR